MRPIRSLPPLNALRAFEAAARHLSFAQAAEELHVTPGAVSHQIASLESYLGLALFKRNGRAVALTAVARAWLPKLSEGFSTLRESMAKLESDREDHALTLSAAPGFATYWLLPRLPRFATAHPDVELRLSTGLGLIDAVRPAAGDPPPPTDAADLEIRFGRGDYPGFRTDRLFTASVTPVCSPALLDGPHPLRTLDDLRHQTLLHDDTPYFDDPRSTWHMWLDLAGVRDVDESRGPRFSHSALALDAAADGLGVALGLTVLIGPQLASGRLVAPFPIALPSAFTYFLVSDASESARPELAAFRQWILEEAAAA